MNITTWEEVQLISPSQLSFQRNEKGVCCFVYTEDNSAKTHHGGIEDMQKEKKTVWVYPSENPIRCPMRIVDKYISLCPVVGPKTK